jgi:lipoate-protein ligase A
MAVDEAILEAVSEEQMLTTLRLYAWEPPCLSLGYAQSINDVDMPRLKERKWDIVRRPTGGRAILHTDELTYSIIGLQSDPQLSGGVLESYRNLSQALLVVLHSLGIPAHSQTITKQTKNPSQTNPVCFEIPSNYEITVGGKKILGSAQARRGNSMLQHGTLPLYGDLSRILEVLSLPNRHDSHQARERLLARATTVEEAIGDRIDWNQVADVFIDVFSQTLKLELIPGELTPLERIKVDKLLNEKYANLSWTERI